MEDNFDTAGFDTIDKKSQRNLLIFLDQEQRTEIAKEATYILNLLFEIPNFEDSALHDLATSFQYEILKACLNGEELSNLNWEHFLEHREIYYRT